MGKINRQIRLPQIQFIHQFFFAGQGRVKHYLAVAQAGIRFNFRQQHQHHRLGGINNKPSFTVQAEILHITEGGVDGVHGRPDLAGDFMGKVSRRNPPAITNKQLFAQLTL